MITLDLVIMIINHHSPPKLRTVPVRVSSKCKWMDLTLVLDFARCLNQETVNSCFVKKKGQIKNYGNLNMGEWKCFLKPQSRFSETGTSDKFLNLKVSGGVGGRWAACTHQKNSCCSGHLLLSSTLLIVKLEIGISWHVSRGHLFRVLEKNSRIVSLPRNVIDRSIVDLKTRILSTSSFKPHIFALDGVQFEQYFFRVFSLFVCLSYPFQHVKVISLYTFNDWLFL